MCYFAVNSSNEANVGAAAADVAAATNDEPPAVTDDKPGNESNPIIIKCCFQMLI